MVSITLQGHDRHGWDTETVSTMEQVRAYLNHAHRGQISVYVDGKEFVLPAGIGRRE